MPDRILRDELLTSERWLSLPRNSHRLAFVCLVVAVDALGNMEAGDGALWRVWRDPLRLDARQAVPEILEALVGADLVRLYEFDGKRFLHLPRSRQRLRYLGRLNPLSPWTTSEEKQRLGVYSPGDGQALTGRSPANRLREVEVEVEVDQNRAAPQKLSTGEGDSDRLLTQWWKSDQGTIDKAKAMGIAVNVGESYAMLRHRLFRVIRERKAATLDSLPAKG